jgi:hypothetical protein
MSKSLSNIVGIILADALDAWGMTFLWFWRDLLGVLNILDRSDANQV